MCSMGPIKEVLSVLRSGGAGGGLKFSSVYSVLVPSLEFLNKKFKYTIRPRSFLYLLPSVVPV